MNQEEENRFKALVKKMRLAQIAYFKQRTRTKLEESKKFERMVDDELMGKISMF